MPEGIKGKPVINKFVLKTFIAGLCILASSATITGGARAAALTDENWNKYLNTNVGSTCVLSNVITIPGDSVTPSTAITTTIEQRLNSIKNIQGGRIYSITLPVGSSSNPDTGSNVAPQVTNDPLQVLSNGDLGVANSFNNLGPGIKVKVRGTLLYPSIANLKMGVRLKSTLTGSAYGVTASGKAELEQMVGKGAVLNLSVSYLVSSAPRLSRITTPSGTYTNLVGVHLGSPNIRFFNLTPSMSSTINGIFKAESGKGMDLYFAKGVGEVRSVDGFGDVSNLSGCSN